MEGYLLDANHVIPLLRGDDSRRAAILTQMKTVSADSPAFIASATLAELEVGCCFGSRERSAAQAEIRETIRTNNVNVLDFTKNTAAEYGALKAALMRKYNREGVRNAAKCPEVWTSPDKGATLGVDEFDLLVVCHALERRLVLVTSDNMLRICDGLAETAERLCFEDWIGPQSADA